MKQIGDGGYTAPTSLSQNDLIASDVYKCWYLHIFIDRKAREIMHLVTFIGPFVYTVLLSTKLAIKGTWLVECSKMGMTLSV